MKKIILLLCTFWGSYLFAQNSSSEYKVNIAKIGLSSNSFYDGDDIVGLAGFSVGIDHALGRLGAFSINIDRNKGYKQRRATNIFYTDITVMTSVETDFRLYSLKGMRGLYAGIGVSYNHFAFKIGKETVDTQGVLGGGLKVGFQTNLNDKINLHFHTGLGLILDELAILKIPLGVQVGYRF